MMVNKKGLIVEEVPHNSVRTVWSAINRKDFIKIVNEFNRASRCESTSFNLNTFEGCKEYTSQDLRRCSIYTYSDFKGEPEKFNSDSKLREHALFLEWIKEREE